MEYRKLASLSETPVINVLLNVCRKRYHDPAGKALDWDLDLGVIPSSSVHLLCVTLDMSLHLSVLVSLLTPCLVYFDYQIFGAGPDAYYV